MPPFAIARDPLKPKGHTRTVLKRFTGCRPGCISNKKCTVAKCQFPAVPYYPFADPAMQLRHLLKFHLLTSCAMHKHG